METVLAQPQRSERHLNVGSLLRLFKSGFFDSWLGVSYLYKYPGYVSPVTVCCVLVASIAQLSFIYNLQVYYHLTLPAASPGVHDYLCNELYNLPDDDIEFYLVQLWFFPSSFPFSLALSLSLSLCVCVCLSSQ